MMPQNADSLQLERRVQCQDRENPLNLLTPIGLFRKQLKHCDQMQSLEIIESIYLFDQNNCNDLNHWTRMELFESI